MSPESPKKLLQVGAVACVSGLLSVPITAMLPDDSWLPLMVPGLLFGLLFVPWLPTRRQGRRWRRSLALAGSCLSYSLAFFTTFGFGFAWPKLAWLGWPLGGMVGGLVLGGALAFADMIPHSWKEAGRLTLFGLLMGLAFGWFYRDVPGVENFIADQGDEWLWALGHCAWQTGLGVLLFQRALAYKQANLAQA